MPLCALLTVILLSGLSPRIVRAQDTQKIDVEVTKVRAKISPAFEVALPSGNIYQHFTQSFNNLDMSFSLNYNILDNNIAGSILFSYPLGRFVPSMRFGLDLDFENYIAPSFSGGAFTLVPTDRYVSRKRSVELGLGYRVTDVETQGAPAQTFTIAVAPAVVQIQKSKLSFNPTDTRKDTLNFFLQDTIPLVPEVLDLVVGAKMEDPQRLLGSRRAATIDRLSCQGNLQTARGQASILGIPEDVWRVRARNVALHYGGTQSWVSVQHR